MKQRYTQEQADDIIKNLRALPTVQPPPKTFNKSEIINLLSKDIRELLKKGYTLNQIVENLNAQGLDIPLSSFRTYLGKSNPKKITSSSRRQKASKPVLPLDSTNVEIQSNDTLLNSGLQKESESEANQTETIISSVKNDDTNSTVELTTKRKTVTRKNTPISPNN